MMQFLIGLAVGLGLFVLLGAAYYYGKQQNKPIQAEKVKPPTEDEQRKAEQMKKDFDLMMSYSVEKARGSVIE